MKKYKSGCFFPICSKKAITAILLVLMSGLSSCKPALYHPADNAETAGSNLAELQQGRKIYIRKCAGCHSLYLPEKYSGDQWQKWMDKMAPKAKLDTAEKELVLKYVRRGQ